MYKPTLEQCTLAIANFNTIIGDINDTDATSLMAWYNGDDWSRKDHALLEMTNGKTKLWEQAKKAIKGLPSEDDTIDPSSQSGLCIIKFLNEMIIAVQTISPGLKAPNIGLGGGKGQQKGHGTR